MSEQGRFTASLLDSSSKFFAAGAVARVTAAGDEALVDGWGFTRLVDDVQTRIMALAEALAVDTPAVLELDLRWLAESFAARGVSPAALEVALTHLADELNEGLPGESAERACRFLSLGLEALRSPSPPPPSPLDADDGLVALATQFVLALLEGRRVDAERLVLDAWRGGATVDDLHTGVILRAQAELGRLWQVGEIQIAEEHLGTRIVLSSLVLLRHHALTAAPTGPKVLVTSVEGNLHDIGGQLVADQLELNGFRPYFLGASTPRDEVLAIIEPFGAQVLAVSAGLGFHVRSTVALIEAVRGRYPDLPIVVGGGPFNRIEGLWQTVGADAWAPSASAGVETIRRLAGS